MTAVTMPLSGSAVPAADAADPTLPATTAPSRASWSGLLRLSLVAVPVKAYPATSSGRDSHFHQLHADCGQRIRYEKHCPSHGKLDAGAIVPGYCYAPDQYLVIDEAELDQLRPPKDQALILERFLDPEHIDPVLYSGRSLYLLPDGPAAHHPYAVLVQALHQRRKWAVGRMVLSTRRQLTLVRPTRSLLSLHLLHYPAQLHARAGLEAKLRSEPANPMEQQLAGQLIDACSPPLVFVWADYRDDSAEQLAALVSAKLQGQTLPAPVADEARILSLVDALQQSVTQAQRSLPVASADPAPERKARKRAPRRRTA